MRLKKVGASLYSVENSKGDFVGTSQEVTSFMVSSGVRETEVKYAMQDLSVKQNDIAIFGVGLSEQGPLFIISQKASSNVDQG